MVDRRDLIKTAMFGGFVGRPDATPDQSAAERQMQEVVDGLRSVSRAIESTNSFSEIAEVRSRQISFLRAEGKFPDLIDVGIDVWMGVHDWHVKHGLPISLSRDGANRYTIMLMTTALVLRPDFVPTQIGTPYENRA